MSFNIYIKIKTHNFSPLSCKTEKLQKYFPLATAFLDKPQVQSIAAGIFAIHLDFM